MSEPTPDAGTSRPRRRVLLVTGALLVLAVLAAVAVTTWGSGTGRSAAATPSPSAPGSAASSPASASTPPAAGTSTPAGSTAPTGPSVGGSAVVDVDQGPPSLAPVPLSSPAASGDGVTASVVSVEAIQGTGSGPGNIAGPALRVTVRLTDGRSSAVSLDGVAVDLTYGRDQTPASPLDDPSGSPFSGTLSPGASRVGVYVFTVPADQRQVVTVSVGWEAGAPVMVFTGSAR